MSKDIRLHSRAKQLTAMALLHLSMAAGAQVALPGPGHNAEHYTRQVLNTSGGLPQDTVREFLQSRDGYIWMATDGGLVRYDGTEMVTFNRRTTPEMASDLVNSIVEDGAGTLWVGTSNGLLERAKGHFRRFTEEDGLPSDAILTVYVDAQQRICVVTSSGNGCRSATGFASVPNDARATVATTRVAAQAEDGGLWEPGSTGLRRTLRGRSETIPMPDGFAGAEILSLFFDKEGDLWVGSANAGAVILRSPLFVTAGEKHGIGSDQVRSVLQDSRGDVWFGTKGGLTRDHDGVFTTSTVKEGLASNEIIALAGDSAVDFWVGTPDGLSHIQPHGVRTLTASDGLPDDNIRSLLLASDHSLWIGTTHGLAHMSSKVTDGRGLEEPTIQTYTTADGLASNVVGALLEDRSGGVWAATRGGLSHVSEGVITSYTRREGLASSIITALGTDDLGSLWVGTSGGGIYEFAEKRLLRAGSSATADLPDTIYGILEDGNGQMWISSPDGIYRIAGKDLHALAEKRATPSLLTAGIVHYDVSDGLRINDCGSGGHPEAIRSLDGHLFFATSKGVSIVNPMEATSRSSAPLIALENVSIDDTAVGETDALRVAPGHERIAFHYAGISFSAASKVRYRYQLEHFDRTWIDAGARRTAYYTNIPPGHYRFRVVASTDGGNWSEKAAALDLTIAPHYYQTWWFYSLLAALGGLLIWQLYLYRLRQVELRFHAVLSERGRIAREIHDTLAQDIVAISVQLELISRLMTLSVDKAREQLLTTRSLVQKSLAEARSSIWDLRSSSSSSMANSDLPTRLREVTRQVVGEAPATLELQITGTYRPSTQDQEEELLRIAQEAVTNAVRHADARKIEVSLNYHSAGVDLRVHDDGRGFIVTSTKSGPPGHYGLRGMHERASRAGARLTIKSQPGAGTTVVAQASIVNDTSSRKNPAR